MTPASGAQLRIRPAERRLLQGALLLAAALLLYGSVAPLMTLQKFYLFENEVSLLSGLRQLVEQGRWLLVLIIGGFSLLLPLLKLLLLWRLLQSWTLAPAWQRWLHWVHHYGKWSMLDVFVVALLLVAVKLGALAQVQIHSGLYAFSGAVLLTMAITARVVQLTRELP